MGIYSDYLDQGLTFQGLAAERKKQLNRISQSRGKRDVLVYASDVTKSADAPIAISYEDLLPISDQLSNLTGNGIDVILETPGGSAEVAEDIVGQLRTKYESVAFIVPGMAKSAGTIMVMAGDEILMDSASSLGPIDAQIGWEGKVFSADALLKGFEKIKSEVEQKNSLNRAYVPILQRISPGELQNAENALEFATILVMEWLQRYKFKAWAKHSTTGKPVTKQEKEQRAREIAEVLCDHGRWLTHGRSIKLNDLEAIRLRITDYGQNADLSDAIRRHHVLLQMTFASNVYKVFETTTSQIYRFLMPAVVPSPQVGGVAEQALVGLVCKKCGKEHQLQADFDKKRPLQPGAKRFPKDDILICDKCGTRHNLADARRQIELKAKREVIRE